MNTTIRNKVGYSASRRKYNCLSSKCLMANSIAEYIFLFSLWVTPQGKIFPHSVTKRGEKKT